MYSDKAISLAKSPSIDLDTVYECVETFLADAVYAKISKWGVQRDALIAKRITAMGRFVTPTMLCVNERYVTRDAWHQAAELMREVDDERAPSAILACLLKAAAQLYQHMNAVDDARRAAADDFVPVLTYVLMMACPKRLGTALAIISAFRAEAQLSGEAGYYFVSYLVSFEFLQRDVASNLVGMNEATFNRRLREEEEASGQPRHDDDWPPLCSDNDVDDFVKL
jgi:hypothetical protein